MAYKGFVKIPESGLNDLKKGQPSQKEGKAYPKGYDENNCFEVVSWAWDAVAPVNHATGQLTGTSVTGSLRLVKYVGTLSQHLVDAIAKNTEFVVTLELFDQLNQEGDTKFNSWAVLTAEKARIASVTLMTAPQQGSVRRAQADTTYVNTAMSSLGGLFAGGDSTHPLEAVEISFRSYSFEFKGTKVDNKSGPIRDSFRK